MKNTIKSKNGGYSVKNYVGKKTGKTFGKVYDGENYLFTGKVRTIEEYKDERRDNECFVKYEVFTTNDGEQFIYWGDHETGEDFLTKISG